MTVMMIMLSFWVSCVLALAPVTALASPQSMAEAAFDERVFFEDIPKVYGASKYEQRTNEAPASVNIITSQDIKKFGYRTLAEILNSLPGFYTSYDRAYRYLGSRGFNRPGDYNSRFLLLVNGHRINDNIYNQAPVGYDFPLDVDLIDRVEVIRGPGSSLYGSNAFFGVINIFTRPPSSVRGAEASVSAGSYDAYTGRLSYGDTFTGGEALLLSGSMSRSQGQDHYYAEYDAPDTNYGWARNADGQSTNQIFALATFQDWTIQGAYADRKKTIPTGFYDTVFNNPDTTVKDKYQFIDVKYERLLANQWSVSGRLFFDRYNYDGNYVYNYAAAGSPPFIVNQKDLSVGEQWGGEFQAGKKISNRFNIVTGGEYVYDSLQKQKSYDEDPYVPYMDDTRDARRWAAFIQGEYFLFSNLILNGGVRYDHYGTFGGEFSPRIALIYHPVENTTAKLIYGQAFRAPNAYELYYSVDPNKANPNLDSERIRQYEIILEHYFTNRLRVSATGFYWVISDLITQQVDPLDSRLVFQNVDNVTSKGAEIELQGSIFGDIEGRLSYMYNDTVDDATHERLSNSPMHLFKINLSFPLYEKKLFFSPELQYTSDRYTVNRSTASDYVIVNATLFSRQLFIKGLESSISVYNLFDKKYGCPVGAEFIQDQIEQDGRQFRLKLTYSF